MRLVLRRPERYLLSVNGSFAGGRAGFVARPPAFMPSISMKNGFRVVGLLLAMTAVAAAEARTWTFEQSGKTVQAELVAFVGDAVELKGADGKTFSVPIAYLTESDRAYLAAERPKQWKQLEVLKLEAAESVGRYQKCTVRGSAVNGEIFITLLPPSVEAILNNRTERALQLTNLSNQIESENRAVRQAKAALPSTAYGNRAYRNTVAAERAQVKLAANDLKNARTNLAKLQKSYDDYVKKTRNQTTVKARNTGVTREGLPVWECFDPRKPQE
jgi:SLA1 homology domain 1, SHD1